jgi:hypothetical protein
MSTMIRLIEGNAKSLCLKSNLEKYFVAAVNLSEAPFPPECLSWGSQGIL